MRPFMSKLKAKKKTEAKKTIVEGDAPRQRLDRPSRMRRADGGVTISEDSKKESGRLRDEATKDRESGVSAIGKGLAIGLAGAGLQRLGMKAALNNAASFNFGRKAPHRMYASGTAGVAGGMGSAGYGLLKNAGAAAKEEEAARIEKGRAEPGKEDRKKGGRVCK